MKYILAITIWILFCWQPVQTGRTQVIPTTKGTPALEYEQKVLKSIIANQEQDIKENKDSLTTIAKGILSGEIKPKTIIKYRYRTKIREVHDTVFLPSLTDHMEQDYIDDSIPCPDTIIIRYIPAVTPKKKTLLQRIFKHKK